MKTGPADPYRARARTRRSSASRFPYRSGLTPDSINTWVLFEETVVDRYGLWESTCRFSYDEGRRSDDGILSSRGPAATAAG
jgi:hypothetical protein